jgi:hypothetical protein
MGRRVGIIVVGLALVALSAPAGGNAIPNPYYRCVAQGAYNAIVSPWGEWFWNFDAKGSCHGYDVAVHGGISPVCSDPSDSYGPEPGSEFGVGVTITDRKTGATQRFKQYWWTGTGMRIYDWSYDAGDPIPIAHPNGLTGFGVEYQGPARYADSYGQTRTAKVVFAFTFGWEPLVPAGVLVCL